MLRIVALLVLLAPAAAHADEPQVSPILYLNRCRGGCTVHGGFDDARAMSSSIPCPGGANCAGGGCVCPSNPAGNYMIEEFKDSAGNTGVLADPEWAEVLKCVRELYSPYAIEVTDQLPPGGLSHNQGIVAGRASSIGYSGVGGIAPGTRCNPRDNVISFTFANQYGGSGLDRVWNICGVVAQETAHAYGLDHAFKFSDGRPACSDPMTYLPDCGQKFFRNDNATCGEWAERPCECGGFQNSHRKLLAIFGPGTPITRPPSLDVTLPVNGATVMNNAVVAAKASAQRGIARLDLYLNGYKWATTKGAAFGANGQPEATYSLLFPSGVPDSIIDIVVKAYDDIDVEAVSQQITVTKGAPCESAATCAKGQECSDGRCFWGEPVGVLGETCDYPQYCVSGECIATTEGSVCSQECVVGVADSCPATFTCEGNAGEIGYCLVEGEDPGCGCNVDGDRRGTLLVWLAVFGLVVRRRRRQR